MLSLTGIVLVASVVAAGQTDALEQVQAKAIGKWERSLPNGNKLVKEIGDSKETLSLLQPDGTVIYQHSVDYEIKMVEGFTIFEFWNTQVLVGGEEEAGEEGGNEEEATEEEPTAERNRYAFKIYNDRWYEAQGLLAGMDRAVNMNIYDRKVEDESTPPTEEERIHPRVVMDYFVGDWHLVGKDENGDETYSGRMTSKWDLHHNALVGRHEFLNNQNVGELMIVRMWDNVSKKLIGRHFASWGVFRDHSYEVRPKGEFFELVGTSEQTTNREKDVSDVVVTIVDRDHFTWSVKPRVEGRPGFTEEYTRVRGVADNAK